MRIFVLLTLAFLPTQLTFAEALFPGTVDFVARGCNHGKSTSMEPMKVPECTGFFCQTKGSVYCYFIRSDLLKDGKDWKEITKGKNALPLQDASGELNWIHGETALLCSLNESQCKDLDLDKCANTPGKEMGCKMNHMVPTFQAIPRERNDEESGIQ